MRHAAWAANKEMRSRIRSMKKEGEEGWKEG